MQIIICASLRKQLDFLECWGKNYLLNIIYGNMQLSLNENHKKKIYHFLYFQNLTTDLITLTSYSLFYILYSGSEWDAKTIFSSKFALKKS